MAEKEGTPNQRNVYTETRPGQNSPEGPQRPQRGKGRKAFSEFLIPLTLRVALWNCTNAPIVAVVNYFRLGGAYYRPAQRVRSTHVHASTHRERTGQALNKSAEAVEQEAL